MGSSPIVRPIKRIKRMIKNTFSNSPVNRLNLHSGLQAFSNDIIYVFFGAYLYKTGLLLWQILAVLGLIYGGRALFRFPAMRLCFKIGVRKTMMLGTVLFPLHFLALGQVHGADVWLAIFIAASAFNDVLYWLPYHTYLTVLGDNEHRGKQIGIREGMSRMGSFLGPVTGGILINVFDFFPTFLIASLVMLAAVLPLLKTPEVHLPDPWPAIKAMRHVQKEGFWLYALWALDTQSYHFIWPLVLFLTLGDTVTMGGLLSLAVLFQIVGCLLTGHLFDKGHGVKLLGAGFFLMAIAVIGKVFLALSIPVIIALDLFFMAGYTFFYPAMNATFYNLSKKSHHPLWFQFMAELGWDAGCALFSLSAMLILHFTDVLRPLMLLALPGMMGMTWLLRKTLKTM